MTDEEIIHQHLDFFAKNSSGCAFAAHASREARHFEWGLAIAREPDLPNLNELVQNFIDDPQIPTLSIIFPDVKTDQDLDFLLPSLECGLIFLNEKLDNDRNRCYRFRLKIHSEISFISGFGPFDYMPITRRTPNVSIVMRVGPRPVYDWHLKEPEPGILHVADMDMKGIPDRNLKRMWNNTFLRTAGLLGHKPDEESAAKTTFVVPLDRARQILL